MKEISALVLSYIPRNTSLNKGLLCTLMFTNMQIMQGIGNWEQSKVKLTYHDFGRHDSSHTLPTAWLSQLQIKKVNYDDV